jgi:hypothetical protein
MVVMTTAIRAREMMRTKARMEAKKGDMLIVSGENWGLLGFKG